MSAVVATRLAELENVVEHGLATFLEVGAALLEIRDSRLYLAGHDSFEAYCRDRWNLERAHAYRLIDAGKVAEALSPMGDSPVNERQARELAPLRDRPELMREAWSEAQHAGNGKPTAAIVRQAVADVAEQHDAARKRFLADPPARPDRTPAYADGDWQARVGAAHRLLREIPSLGQPDDVVALIHDPPRPIGDAARFITAARDAQAWIQAFIERWDEKP